MTDPDDLDDDEHMTLAEFLRARWSEERAVAEAVPGDQEWGRPHSLPDGTHLIASKGAALGSLLPPAALHAVLHDPGQVLREIDAKRQILDRCEDAWKVSQQRDADRFNDGESDGLELAVRLLALPYADHPDYREEWRP